MTISLSELIVAVMLAGVTLVGGLWIYTLWRERRREIHRRRIAIQCRICGCAYAYPAPGKAAAITVCPACGSKNERHGMKPI